MTDQDKTAMLSNLRADERVFQFLENEAAKLDAQLRPSGAVVRDITKRLRAALASAPVAGEAHPVAWLHQCRKKPELATVTMNKREPALAAKGYRPIPLYAAPQASEAVRLCIPPAKPLPDLMMASYHEAIGWNECRAAILQSAALSAQPGAQKQGDSDV